MQASSQPQPTTISITGADGKPIVIDVPKTQADVDGLVSRRSQLSEQIENVSDRRGELVTAMQSAPSGLPRAGLEERIKLLDQRLLQLESDLASTGQALAMAPGDLVSIAQRRTNPPPSGDDFGEGIALGAFLMFVAFILYGGFRRWRRKRRGITDKQPQLAGESNERLHRLEQGMEAIAIEIERISEGQRFVTRLLSESHASDEVR